MKICDISSMAKDYSQVNFRIPTKLKEDIEKAALENERSITSELVSRLEESFEEKNSLPPEVIEALEQSNCNLDRAIKLINKLMEKVEELESKKPTV